MSISGGIRAALFAGLACACSASPDVVATQHVEPVRTDASDYINAPSAIPCQPGQYKGYFATDYPDASASAFEVDGDFSFTLTRQPMGEFTTLADDAKLSGTAQANVVTFDAKIVGGSRCIDGGFSSQIVDGSIYVGQGGTPIPFHGTVAGWYDITVRGFRGHWQIATGDTDAQATLGLHLHGDWSASLIPAKK